MSSHIPELENINFTDSGPMHTHFTQKAQLFGLFLKGEHLMPLKNGYKFLLHVFYYFFFFF